jgi:hypothetical protein
MTFEDACSDQEIYEAAQRYRHAPLEDQSRVVAAYHEMLRTIWERAQGSHEGTSLP